MEALALMAQTCRHHKPQCRICLRVTFLIDSIREHPADTVTIATLGPLTVPGLALQQARYCRAYQAGGDNGGWLF